MMLTTLKTLLAVAVLGLCLGSPVRADELRLNDGADSVTAAKAKLDAQAASATDTRAHLGLNEQSNARLGELSTGQTNAPGPMLGGSTADVSQDWATPRASQPLALDAPASSRPMATLAPALPAGDAADSGIPDGWVYAGLVVLALALAWVCKTSLRRPRSAAAATWSPGGEGAIRSSRQRVKMVALKR